MDLFKTSCLHAQKYPSNLLSSDTYEYKLRAIADQLDQRAALIFCDGSSPRQRASVNMLDSSIEKGLELSNASSLVELQDRCQRDDMTLMTRFVSIEAPSSRAQLKITRQMFNYLMTYLQATPSFVEFVLPFRKSHYKQDIPFCGFRNTSRLQTIEGGIAIPQLGRSGRQIELCYSLMSVEPHEDSEHPDGMRWPIRMCSIHHFFDIESGKTSWVTVKGNNLIRKLVESHMESSPSSTSVLDQLHRSLQIHLLLAHWSAEYWHSYINFRQESLQDKCRHATSVSVESTATMDSLKKDTQTNRLNIQNTLPQYHFKDAVKELFSKVRNIQVLAHPTNSSEKGTTYAEPKEIEVVEEGFSFSDLQDIQFIGEKATEAMLALTANRNALDRLRLSYISMAQIIDPRGEWSSTIDNFTRKLDDLLAHFDMQKTNAETLLAFVGERKALLYAILECKNMQASRHLAENAQESTYNMELMTLEMRTIARKTKVETVSMRVITLVTLFFLPGTFISTLMSTPIVTFEDGNKTFGSNNIGEGALQFYVAVSLPLMCFTFVVWYVVHWWENRCEKKRAQAQQAADPQYVV